MITLHCPFCFRVHPAGSTQCGSCGADLVEGVPAVPKPEPSPPSDAPHPYDEPVDPHEPPPLPPPPATSGFGDPDGAGPRSATQEAGGAPNLLGMVGVALPLALCAMLCVGLLSSRPASGPTLQLSTGTAVPDLLPKGSSDPRVSGLLGNEWLSDRRGGFTFFLPAGWVDARPFVATTTGFVTSFRRPDRRNLGLVIYRLAPLTRPIDGVAEVSNRLAEIFPGARLESVRTVKIGVATGFETILDVSGFAQFPGKALAIILSGRSACGLIAFVSPSLEFESNLSIFRGSASTLRMVQP